MEIQESVYGMNREKVQQFLPKIAEKNLDEIERLILKMESDNGTSGTSGLRLKR